jgi:signal transduction histidine kinase
VPRGNASTLALVMFLDTVFGDWQGHHRSIPATAAVAAAFHPMQVQVQRAVGRLLFGDRADPYAAVSRMSRTLEGGVARADEPTELLPAIAQAVADALHLPYVALRLEAAPGRQAAVEFGRRTGEVEVIPMTHHGKTVGQLIVSPRSQHAGFRAPERRLLRDLARQAALAAHAVVLTGEVQRARERLVRAREEERRRLRRDLHDGLGAALAGLRMQVSTSPYLLESGDVAAIRQLFGWLDDELARYTVQVRRLIEGLTPAPLEQLGLPGAVRRAAAVFERGTHPLTVDVISDGVPERPGQLAAAVEIAAYHISVEGNRKRGPPRAGDEVPRAADGGAAGAGGRNLRRRSRPPAGPRRVRPESAFCG